jgi:hypothetical protein
MVAIALVIGTAWRLLVGWNNPLWLDETYTGMIAMRPDIASLIRECLRELSGPVYYSTIWVWAKLAGVGNDALRVPSLLFSLAAPLLIWWRGHPERTTRLVWGALTVLWLPGLEYAIEARPYALLFMLGCIQAILLGRLLRAPSVGRAFFWCVVSALLILTHYHTLVVTGLQGLLFLLLRWRHAWRAWPAALVFVPVAGWMAIHLPLLFRFADPNVAWQQVLGPGDVTALPYFMLGGGHAAALILGLVLLTAGYDLIVAMRRRAALPYDPVDIAVAGASFLAVAIVFSMAFVRPSFSPRYLIPFMPGVLLGLAAWAARWERVSRFVPLALVGIFALLALRDLQARRANPELPARYVFSWQHPSRDLKAAGARRLFFFWDNPTTAIADPEPMAQVAGFFFAREGADLPVRALILAGRRPPPDPNRALAALATRPGDTFIWAFDRNVAGTLALTRPPRFDNAPGWRCRDYGRDHITVLTCLRG